MKWILPNVNAHRELLGRLTKLADLEIEKLIRKEELGAASFEQLRGDLEFVLITARDALDLGPELGRLPAGLLASLTAAANACHDSFLRLVAFDISQPHQRGDRIQEVKNQASNFASMYAVLANVRDAMANPLALVGSYRTQLEEQHGLARTAATETQATEAEAKMALARVLEAAAVVDSNATKFGADAHKSKFSDAANAHEDASRKWLLATVGAVIVLGAVVAFGLANAPGSGAGEIAHYVLVRTTLLFIFAFTVIACTRNYRAHRHLAVTNRHRAMALATFETFVKGTSDEATKNAVLLEATRCIFALGQSGYSSGDDDGVGRAIEVVKLAGSK